MSLSIPNGGAEILSGPSGLCPVQAFGTVRKGGTAHCWYFRAIVSEWTLTIGDAHPSIERYVSDDGAAVWAALGKWGAFPDAGYMPEETARLLIQEALTRYCAGEPPWKAPDDLRYAEPGGEE